MPQGPQSPASTARSWTAGSRSLQSNLPGAVRCPERSASEERSQGAAAACSCALLLELRQILPEGDQRLARFLHRAHAARRHTEESLRPAAPFGRRTANGRRHQLVPLQPVQRGIGGAEEHAAAARSFDFARDLHAIRLVARPHRGQQQHQLEVGKQVPRHFFTNYEQLASGCQLRRRPSSTDSPGYSGCSPDRCNVLYPGGHMTAKELMTPNPACCTKDASLQEVARLMVQHDCGEIPIVERKDLKKVVGVVTDR